MDRLACIDLPAFPLQLLLKRHASWRDHPVAVVDRDKPQGKILWVNERARAFRILPGMRYAAGLSLAGDLHAAEMPAGTIEQAIDALGRQLRNFTPHVEPSRDDPGVFWVDATGLERLHASLKDWAGGIRSELKRSGYLSTLVIGFSRFGTYALAKGKRGLLVLNRPVDEHCAASRVGLDRLAIDPPIRETLDKLGVRTVGEFVKLPGQGIDKRFGPEAGRLHRLASGLLDLPLQPEQPLPPAVQRVILDHAETKVQRLLARIERMVPPLLAQLADRGHALTGLEVGFRFERLGDHVEQVRPAAQTLDAKSLLELVRLRLEAIRKLPDGVIELLLVAEGEPATREQQQLFRARKRDPAAANRALARLRAELGNDAVKRARLRQAHLPEASFAWENADTVTEARPRDVDRGTLVRRIYTRPVPLPARPRHEPDGWMLRDLKQGPVIRVLGPYVVSGGWWQKTVHREYHFAETQKGELLWVYYDRARRRWYMQGRVE